MKYHLGDHLGSSTVVIDASGAWINREEYFPYGETSFGSFARKRYRFTGKERDEESGLYYHGARYYGLSLARWISADPIGHADGLNLYSYVENNPLRYSDRHGLAKDGDGSDQQSPTICYEPEVSTDAAGRMVLHIHPRDSNVIHKAKPPSTNPSPESAGQSGTEPASNASQDTKPSIPDIGQAGTPITAIGTILSSLPNYVSRTSVAWAGNI